MKPTLLTIMIPSLQSRSDTLIELLESLREQDRSDEVEILIDIDAGSNVVGDKRNRLLQAAVGRYVCSIDDDDQVAHDYIPKVLAAIEANPDVDAIAIRGRRTIDGGKAVEFDYRLDGQEGQWIDGTLWRTPGHLCPIRAELAKSVKFPYLLRGEDLPWGVELAPLLKTIARAGDPGEVLYLYRFDPHKDTPRARAWQMQRVHERIFTPQYTERSGPGSTPEFSAPYREFLHTFIREHHVRSIVDLGCGDLQIMSRVDLQGARYRGADVIAERVRRNAEAHPGMTFEHRDARTWEFPRCDLVLCKDVIQHWSNEEIERWLEHMKARARSYRFALITNCTYGATLNQDCKTGGWRAVDLMAPPFSTGERVFNWGTPNKDVVLIRGTRPARP
ncbi:MAG: glycosyltransferase [Kofleriaceae bacterium]